jgi:hypothetical protein
MAGHAHQACHALNQKIIAGAPTIGAGLTETGNRAIDDLRINLFDLRIIETIFGQCANFVVFNNDVGLFGGFGLRLVDGFLEADG